MAKPPPTKRPAATDRSAGAGSGFPESDPFAGAQPEIDLARDGNRRRGDDRRNTGRLPDRKENDPPR
jgi:hypothetical protein